MFMFEVIEVKANWLQNGRWVLSIVWKYNLFMTRQLYGNMLMWIVMFKILLVYTLPVLEILNMYK